MTLTPYQLERIGGFLRMLGDWKRSDSIDVCAYGGIDVEVGEQNITRIEWSETNGNYVLTEQLR